MKMNNNEDNVNDQYNAEYVVLQTANMNISNKSSSGKLDSLGLLLEESESVTNFRRFLDSIDSGHFLDFWFACQGFKNFDKSDSHKINQLMKVIYKAYIKSESPFAVPLKSNTKKSIVDKLNVRKIFDPTIFDTAQLEIRDILAGEFLIKFYKSEFYTDSNLLDKDSLSSFNNNPQSNDVPVSSCSSTGYISRRSVGACRNLVASRSYDAVSDGCGNRTQSDNSISQTTGTQGQDISSGGFNENYLANNATSMSSRDRRNLSEIDPTAFAKVLSGKLEEVFAEQTNFERMLRFVKSVPNESDTDDSHSSAINYLLKCQWYSSQTGQCCSGDGDLGAVSSCNRIKSCSGDIRDDYAQDILESHCSRIGLIESQLHPRRDSAEIRGKWRRKDIDLGSTTSYDSGVATSLEPQSSVCVPSQLQDTIFCQLQQRLDSSKTSNNSQIDPRYNHHHHHHHHHHKNHGDSSLQKDLLRINNVSDVSSNLDSGISSTYDNLGRRFQPMDDKVTNWMIKNPKVTSKQCCKFNDSSYPSHITSGIPPNTPLISSRGLSSLSSHDIYPNHQSSLLSPLPSGSGIRPCQNIEYWLEQQDSVHPLVSRNESRSRNYCSSTVGVAGSELFSREDTCSKDLRSCQSSNNPSSSSKDPQMKPRPPGPLVVGYYMGNDPVPYRTQIPDAQQITLGQFKSLIAKKGPFRYFFKRYCDEFECGVVHEEITKDDAILPLWEGKIVAKIEKSD